MKNFLKAIPILILLCGCGTIPVGSTKFPEPATSFQPKMIYTASYDKMWEVVIDTLDLNKIPIASSDKSEGRITTEYIQGRNQTTVRGFLGLDAGPIGCVSSTRYRYSITIDRKNSSTQRLKIIVKLETSRPNVNWYEITNESKETVTKLENWLYEKIEKYL